MELYYIDGFLTIYCDDELNKYTMDSRNMKINK